MSYVLIPSPILFCLLPVNVLMNNVGFGNQLLLNSCVIQLYLEFTKEKNKISTVNHADVDEAIIISKTNRRMLVREQAGVRADCMYSPGALFFGLFFPHPFLWAHRPLSSL